ncbi:MAG: sulfur carrier protein ThiS [Elusimicrobiota bacterium]
MKINVNGQESDIENGYTLSGYLNNIGITGHSSIVIEYNGEILRCGGFEAVDLKDGDNIEIFRFMAGG